MTKIDARSGNVCVFVNTHTERTLTLTGAVDDEGARRWIVLLMNA